MTNYFLINRNCGIIGGHDYGSKEAAEKAIETGNIPKKDAEIMVFEMRFTNNIDYSKCTPLNKKWQQ